MGPLIPYFERPIFDIPLPDGFPIESIPLHGFGILVALGFLIGGRIAINRARRVGLDGDAINRLIGWLVVGTFIGGHVGYGLMYKPGEYLSNPVKFLQVWEGLSSFGGFLVCVPLSIWFFKRNRMPLWPNLDSLAIGFALGWFFGRMGCTVAHDHPGSPSDNPLAIYCRPIEGDTLSLPRWMAEKPPPGQVLDLRWGPCKTMDVPGAGAVTSLSDTVPKDYAGVVSCHDTGFYEALFSLGMLLVFLFLDRKPRVPGLYPLLLGLLYAPFRFWLDSLRPDDTDGRVWIFTPGQWWSIVLLGICAWFLYKRLTSGDAPVWAPYGTKHADDDDASGPPSEDGSATGA